MASQVGLITVQNCRKRIGFTKKIEKKTDFWVASVNYRRESRERILIDPQHLPALYLRTGRQRYMIMVHSYTHTHSCKHTHTHTQTNTHGHTQAAT